MFDCIVPLSLTAYSTYVDLRVYFCSLPVGFLYSCRIKRRVCQYQCFYLALSFNFTFCHSRKISQQFWSLGLLTNFLVNNTLVLKLHARNAKSTSILSKNPVQEHES